MPRPSVLTDAHDLSDDLDWLAPWTRRSPRACGSGRAGTPHCTGRCRKTQESGLRVPFARQTQRPAGGRTQPDCAQQARPRDQTDHGASYDELFTELVHSAEATRPWHGWCAPPRPITNTPGPNTKSMPEHARPDRPEQRDLQKTRSTTTESPRPRPPDVPRPSVLTDAHDLPDDMDWLAPWTRRSPRP